MAPFLYRQPFKAMYIFGFLATMAFIQLQCWLIYYSWRPNRPRKNWTLRRTINVQIIRNLSKLPFKVGVRSNRDLSLGVPQGELERYNSRFVWIPELEKEDIVGMIGEYAKRAGVKSMTVPAYWILKDNVKWLPAYEKAQKDEKVIMYIHGGAFMVQFFSPLYPVPILTFATDGNSTPVSPNSVYSQGDTQTFHISLPSVVGRLPTQLRAPLRVRKPVPSCSPRYNRDIQVSCLRGRISG